MWRLISSLASRLSAMAQSSRRLSNARTTAVRLVKNTVTGEILQFRCCGWHLAAQTGDNARLATRVQDASTSLVYFL
jgi:hypothetical protein